MSLIFGPGTESILGLEYVYLSERQGLAYGFDVWALGVRSLRSGVCGLGGLRLEVWVWSESEVCLRIWE